MKNYIPDIKLVRELTKYISPKEIEKARFKRYNMPKFNDGNLLCDEFFRTEELFDKKIDRASAFNPYSVDDIPAIKNSVVNSGNFHRVSNLNASYPESNLPYYVDIIGENKRIYIEQYGIKDPRHPYEADFIGSNDWLNQNLYTNRTIDEIVNIKYLARKLAEGDSYGLELEALSLLKNGYPLDAVLNIMKKAALKQPDGKLLGCRGMMRFITQYPDLRRYMVTYANDKSEVFDSFGAKMFPELLELCNNDKKLAYKILWDCRAEMHDGWFLTHPELLTIGKYLFKIDNSWNDKKAKLVQLISEKSDKTYSNCRLKIVKLLRENTPVQDMIEDFTPFRKHIKMM